MTAHVATLPQEATADGTVTGGGFGHVPVLADEVVQLARAAFAATPLGWIVDCTVGGGGHADALLHALPQARLLALDRDPEAVQAARTRLAPHGERARIVHGTFSGVAAVAAQHTVRPIRLVVADLGVSSHQFDTARRGFSLRLDGPLDMRMDATCGESLADLLANVRVEELADVLYDYGDIRRSIGTARIVLESVRGGATTTGALAALLERRLGRVGRIHAATQVFQALRMWVNDEAAELDAWLRDAPGLADVDGTTLACITFHSGDDRAVKQAFAKLERVGLGERRGRWERATRKALVASAAEQASNPRSRSAKLRALRWSPGSAPDGDGGAA
ncbi:MAG: 16S rRNA (cytosine(1402)-N(4))-methyltransferase RsmH [Myxococcales bacterium]|nr:16S rRNA (cytosine(1402)-N(4))-methyltransferase RsmH [Myxococcales bacterium]